MREGVDRSLTRRTASRIPPCVGTGLPAMEEASESTKLWCGGAAAMAWLIVCPRLLGSLGRCPGGMTVMPGPRLKDVAILVGGGGGWYNSDRRARSWYAVDAGAASWAGEGR